MATVVRSGTLFDGTGAEAMHDGVVVIDGGRIQAVGPAETTRVPQGATVVDLHCNFVMPGLVDAHTHASINPGNGDQTGQMRRPAVKQALQATANLRRDLLAGTTTMRLMAEEYFLDIDLREGIDRGIIVGPVCCAPRAASPLRMATVERYRALMGWTRSVAACARTFSTAPTT
jgi:imidazolonepropionase-like amidohydrolase